MLNEAAQTENSETSSPSVLSVEQLNRAIRQLIEGQLSLVWVQGEISNFKAHTSGHFYFSLKDAKSQISAVMFRGHNSRLKFKPSDGLQVIIRGRVTVYEPRGNYQIAVEMMEPVGAGALQKAYEQLKVKLKNEGLFDQARKKPLPHFPQHLAIVTSPTGAAIRDMMNVLDRRNRMTPVTLIPSLVQGEGAAGKIIAAIDMALRLPNVDVIIVGRGGGSIEDLWAFNDEALARKIASSPIPIISAVGHEIDFTIADFVADVRAPTPSAAAELVVKNADDLARNLQQLTRMNISLMNKRLVHQKQLISQLSKRLIDPKRRLQDLMIRRDELVNRLSQSAVALFKHKKMRVELAKSKLVRPEFLLDKLKSELKQKNLLMQNAILHKLKSLRWTLESKMAMIDTLSPLKTVDRGYSLAKLDEKIVNSIKQVKKDDIISLQVRDGILDAKIIKIKEKGHS